ncbi:hypothetical protein JCM17846_19600 [Iodidimonas nitroreducens]|uniref:DUF3800 domain-containing protein n=1 Tax=Iodidimonas nitroreducens TaxID=1236968 RepID=A0A5A7N867_9PROT|nr:DUF3800 domain-containing protein [Iodidimonas nitroreducens]GAK33173.1 hypothetical protein AQ1_01058 [alpha proteobacterium Q-1]GER04278.1 hypothetical protein JCM17846_19600 [Iodidimonas nitroreducens]
MTEERLFNVYCDESCHLEHDGSPVMAWGAIYCPEAASHIISLAVRKLKSEHGLAPDFEAKWTKISPAKVEFYLALLDLFLADERMRFRGILVPDKGLLDHARFGQSHDDWYYKMYFTMLRPIFCAPHHYRIYLDIKDTRGGPRTRRLHEVLANSLYDFNQECVERVQQVRSHESEQLQLADILIGALTYANRGLRTSPAKTAIAARLCERLGQNILTRTSSFSATKFNILVWRARDLTG